MRRHARLFFPLGAVGGLVLPLQAYPALSAAPHSLVLPLGLPDLPFHLRLDALSAFFLLLLGVVSAGVSLYSAGYFDDEQPATSRLICLQYHVFLASMAMVLLADDAYLFMVAWETMALASYFLVTTDHEVAEIRSAGFLYLIVAHVGAIAILLCFGTLQLGQWNYTLRRHARQHLVTGLGIRRISAGAVRLRRQGRISAGARLAARGASGRAFAGVGADERRDAEDRHLRSAARHLRPAARTGLVVGSGGAVRGPAHGAVRRDVRRRADRYEAACSPTRRSRTSASSSAGIGLTILFHGYDMNVLAALALAATLYHCLNHALFKTLLFLVTGSVMHATSHRSLGKLGGLIRPMPWVAALALIGTLAHRRPAAAQWLRLGVDAVPGLPAHARACPIRI